MLYQTFAATFCFISTEQRF